MKQQAIVAEQFGSTARTYLTSAVHAQGEDLKIIQKAVSRYTAPRVLDLGCGAGHVSFAAAPFAQSITAYDLSPHMLAVVAQAASERRLVNIETRQGPAENLPFEDASFDLVVSRMSAHHWLDVPAALKEAARVLKRNGMALFVDIIAPEIPLHDTTLQAIELLRDASHVRDYRVTEWADLLSQAGFMHECRSRWRLTMEFNEWTARMRTPAERVQAIRSLLDSAPDETRKYFSVQSDYTFSIDAALFAGTRIKSRQA